MLIRKANVVLVSILIALPQTAATQDAAAVIAALRQGVGKELPRQLRITAAGSGYTGTGEARRHYRIESYAQELDFMSSTATERIVRLELPQGAAQAASQTDTRAAKADSPWSDQYSLWSSPLGFVTAAAASSPGLSTEKVYGTTYQVLTVRTSTGQEVKGYVTDKNVLERTRTNVQDSARGNVQIEMVFYDWTDFNGLRYPTLIIQRENNEVARILVVSKVETGPAKG